MAARLDECHKFQRLVSDASEKYRSPHIRDEYCHCTKPDCACYVSCPYIKELRAQESAASLAENIDGHYLAFDRACDSVDDIDWSLPYVAPEGCGCCRLPK